MGWLLCGLCHFLPPSSKCSARTPRGGVQPPDHSFLPFLHPQMAHFGLLNPPDLFLPLWHLTDTFGISRHPFKQHISFRTCLLVGWSLPPTVGDLEESTHHTAHDVCACCICCKQSAMCTLIGLPLVVLGGKPIMAFLSRYHNFLVFMDGSGCLQSCVNTHADDCSCHRDCWASGSHPRPKWHIPFFVTHP